MSDHPVPSTHYQSVNGEPIPIPIFIPPTQEVVSMDEITQNPFNDIREAKTLKYMMRRKDGSLYEFDMSILTKPFEEMSNMELVLAWIKAHQIFDLLEKKMQAYTETDEYSFRDWKKAVKLDKETYAVERLAEEFLFEKFQMESHILESKSERLQSARLGLHPGEWVQTPATVLCPWDDENYNPGYVYSYRILQPKIKKHTGEGSVDITEFLVSDITGRSQDEKQKRRLLIEFNTYTASTSGSHYKKKWPYAMMITRTKDGLRIMWVRVRGKKGQKFIFGASYSMMERKKLQVPIQFPCGFMSTFIRQLRLQTGCRLQSTSLLRG